MSTFKKSKKLISLGIVLTVIITIFIAAWVYLGTYYRADTEAIEAFAHGYELTYAEKNGITSVSPENPSKALIFYPGGKVEHKAYLPLMYACASRGILCILVEMPFRLAVFDINAADGIREQYPEIEEWYIAGHSLGGSMAAAYLGEKSDGFNGLILLGSYSTENLSEKNLRVLSIFGTEDTVMNRKKYADTINNLPKDLIEIEIEGGCHAYFGMYGEQKGDGTALISNAEQILFTADAICNWIEN